MKKAVQQLVELQEIDSRFDELQLQKGDLPMVIEDLEENLSEKKEYMEELQTKNSKGEADRRMFQLEIDASKTKLTEYEEKLYQVKTNKEYDAISLEIDTKKMEINELENKILQTLEDEQEIEETLKTLTTEVDELEKQLKEHYKELDEIVQQTKEEEERLKKQKSGLVGDIAERLLRQYERIRKAKGGLAVVKIERGSCGGCFSAIPPQRIVEIREQNRLNTCEYCGRILVWEDGVE